MMCICDYRVWELPLATSNVRIVPFWSLNRFRFPCSSCTFCKYFHWLFGKQCFLCFNHQNVWAYGSYFIRGNSCFVANNRTDLSQVKLSRKCFVVFWASPFWTPKEKFILLINWKWSGTTRVKHQNGYGSKCKLGVSMQFCKFVG